MDPTDPTLWQGDVPVSTRFDDPYYALGGGLQETQHVFLAGNRLPARWHSPLRIAELGFGTGLNLLVTWQAWSEAGAQAPLHFTSFEAYPMAATTRARALGAFPSLAPLAAQLAEAMATGPGPWDLAPGLTLDLQVGDARDTLPRWSGVADAWFLDGFSPAKNPQLWEPALLAEVYAHTAPGGSFATYTAAGHVRRALGAAGFEVSRAPGFGRKRHMTQGLRPA